MKRRADENPHLLHPEAFPNTVYLLEGFFLLGFQITERLSVSCSYRDHKKTEGEQVAMSGVCLNRPRPPDFSECSQQGGWWWWWSKSFFRAREAHVGGRAAASTRVRGDALAPSKMFILPRFGWLACWNYWGLPHASVSLSWK